MTVKHWNTGASAERYRAGKQASEQKYKKIVDMVIEGQDGHIPSAFSILDLITFLEVDLFDSCVFADMIGVFLTGSLFDLS